MTNHKNPYTNYYKNQYKKKTRVYTIKYRRGEYAGQLQPEDVPYHQWDLQKEWVSKILQEVVDNIK